jgi:cyclophilin family peptidyl-prolyl cis-trans isomerase
MKTIILIIISCLIFSGIEVNSQIFDKTEQQILEAQDLRSSYFSSDIMKITDDAHLKRLLLAFANIVDSNYMSVESIMKIYSNQETIHNGEGDQNIQSLAVWALGQIPCRSSMNFLRIIEGKEANEYSYQRIKNYCSILNAIGKIGNDTDLANICKLDFNNDSLNGALALSIARFGMRKINSPGAIEKLDKLASVITDESQKQWLAYAFSRIGDKDLLKDSHKELEALAASTNPYCRMWAYSAMGKTNDQSYIEYIMKWYAAEKDWRCRVNMLNSIGNLSTYESALKNEYFDIILNSVFNDSNANVSITACQALAKICTAFGKESNYSQKLKNQFEFYLTPGKAVDYHVRNEMITALAKVFKDEYRRSLFSLFTQTEDYDTKSLIISAFQYMNDPMVYKEMRDSISNEVQRYNLKNPNKDGTMIGSPDLAKLYRAFVEALSVLDDKMDEENKNNTRLIFTEFASSKEPAIMDICLSSLTDSLYEKYREETGIIMGFDIEGFDQVKDRDAILLYIDAWGKMKTKSAEKHLGLLVKSKDYEIAKAAADALKIITGKEYVINNPMSKKIYNWDYLNKLSSKRTALINTELGQIKIELFPDIAIFTIENFVKLTESGYYNNTIFHRVVPNFVIQGGDPKGTGYGGPGYSIRTEVADNTFDAYYVGMASSGKDTEGNQFFITHCPTPHLDGKYTIFGKVTDGFDVVDKIQIGDKIINITIQ